MARPRKTKKTLFSMGQASVALNIPPEHLRAIKILCPDGWASNGQVYADVVSKFYDENKEKIINAQFKSKEELVKEKLSNDIILQKIEIEEAKKQTVNVKEVEAFMTNFGTQLGALLKNRLIKELPPRIVGLKEEAVTALCKEYYNEIVKVLSKNITEWNNNVDDRSKE